MGRQKACYAQSVVCSDEFRELPEAARLLYFELGFFADNDGAIDGIKGIARMAGASLAEIEILSEAGYLIYVDGVPFITHWWVNNKTDKKNYRPGGHQRELAQLIAESGAPYMLSDERQTDESLTSVANINEYKGIEDKGTKKNSTKKNQKKLKEIETPISDPEVRECPECGTLCFISFEGSSIHGFCDECNVDFFIGKETGEVTAYRNKPR